MDRVRFLQKFGRREHIESFANDGLYCSNAEIYWGIEDNMKIRGQGDHLEASSMFFAQHMTVYDHDGGEIVGEFGVLNGLARYEPAKNIPVFCMFAVLENDCVVDDNGVCRIALSNQTKSTIKEHFPNADTVAIISNPEQFLLDIERSIGCMIKHELVHYFNIDKGYLIDEDKRAMDHEYVMYLTQDTPPIECNESKTYKLRSEYVYRVLLCKDIFFKDEQEYRIVLPKESISQGKLYPVKYSCKPEIICLDDFFHQ